MSEAANMGAFNKGGVRGVVARRFGVLFIIARRGGVENEFVREV